MSSYLSDLASSVGQGLEDLARGVQGKETGETVQVKVQFRGAALGLTVSDSGGEGVVTAVGGEAAAHGLELGDRVVKVDGRRTSRYADVVRALRAHAARPLDLTLERRRPRSEEAPGPGFVNFRMDEECAKAERILKLMLASPKSGPSRGVLEAARGLAFLRVTKVGFAFSGRFGTGLVVARLKDGGWSAPSAIGTVGLSMGFQAGAQVADFLIVLNTRAAVTAFSGGGHLTIGAQLGAVAGPLGASREAGVAGQPEALAPIYTYAIAKGIFLGASLEGAAINERTSVNERHYARAVRASEILAGAVEPMPSALELMSALAALNAPEEDFDAAGAIVMGGSEI